MPTFQSLEQLVGQAFPLRFRDNTHNCYSLPGGKLLSLATNRRSVFGFKLGFEIEGQGEIINAFNIAASMKMRDLSDRYDDDLLAFGRGIDKSVPQELKNNPHLQRCATVIDKVEYLPIRSVTRFLLTGSPFEEYTHMRTVCDRELPAFLFDGSPIPDGPIWAPTRRIPLKRDEPFGYKKAKSAYPELEELDLCIFRAFAAFAYGRGVMVVDAKKDFGLVYDEIGRGMDPVPSLVCGGERFTPDTSRFVYADDYDKAVMNQGRLAVPSQGKQILRDWAKIAGLHCMDPSDLKCRSLAATLVPQASVLERYRISQLALFERLYGMSIADFQRAVMNIKD